ncbi:Lamin tail domain-containing protein 1 [Labeo rohita]|uniref:Lamin tail domain-containing protein 1 n=1 Tax=Labeo rohita TaxID=84645 RepID=A0ABQ8L892_LABRO|nr:Lamin tail domain-containing protein 1 [Labeo rohita]
MSYLEDFICEIKELSNGFELERLKLTLQLTVCDAPALHSRWRAPGEQDDMALGNNDSFRNKTNFQITTMAPHRWKKPPWIWSLDSPLITCTFHEVAFLFLALTESSNLQPVRISSHCVDRNVGIFILCKNSLSDNRIDNANDTVTFWHALWTAILPQIPTMSTVLYILQKIQNTMVSSTTLVLSSMRITLAS